MSDRTNVRGLHISLTAETVTFTNELSQLLILPVDFPLHVQLGFRKTPVRFTQITTPILQPSDYCDGNGTTSRHQSHDDFSTHNTLF